MSIPQISPGSISNYNERPMTPYPANSEEFYRFAVNSGQITARLDDSAMERETYLNSVNHEMDAIEQRTMANGGVVTPEDAERYTQLEKLMGEVLQSPVANEHPEFRARLELSLQRARDHSPAP